MTYKINVVYSIRKTASLIVKDGALLIRAPFGMTEDQISKMITKHEGWIQKSLEKQARIKENELILTEEKIKELKKRAKEYLKQRTDYFSNIMGLKYGRITITSAKGRFGSCNSKKDISYSYRLMLYPAEAIDYVVVHELSHTVHMNHSKNFYKLIESVLPDYKKLARLLKG